MLKFFSLLFSILIMFGSASYAGFFDDLLKGIGIQSGKTLDNETIVSGLKEALSVGTKKAVDKVSKPDGYLANAIIKIPMPENIKKVTDVLSKLGYGKYADDFIVSMNRAAEKAAPVAASHFIDAVKQMTFEDARGILNGPETAATNYFREKTSERLYKDMRPIISSTMNKVGVTKLYKDMMGKYTSLPFVKAESFDLDNYVTDRALKGLFYMIAQEEKKIRTDPAARVTDLLKKVFSR